MAMDRSRYPPDWWKISIRIRVHRAGNRCEWVDDAGNRCEALNHLPSPITGSLVILTVAHLDHTPENNDEGNLLAMCQYHHLRYDSDHHVARAHATRRQRKREAGQLDLFDIDAD